MIKVYKNKNGNTVIELDEETVKDFLAEYPEIRVDDSCPLWAFDTVNDIYEELVQFRKAA